MKIDFVSLFPQMIEEGVSHSILRRAQEAGLVKFQTCNPRDFATDPHKKVDDSSYGGGPGMVLMAPLIQQAVDSLSPTSETRIILLDAAGEPFRQETASELSGQEHLILICGRYEGVDERVRTKIATHCYSIGDYVLTGGELPALVLADSVTRLIPGALGKSESHEDDSFVDGLLGFPLYTKPTEFQGESVPEVLLSGNHAAIAKWRKEQQIERTKRYRPDLWAKHGLSGPSKDES